MAPKGLKLHGERGGSLSAYSVLAAMTNRLFKGKKDSSPARRISPFIDAL
jgi:hypothetical protein